MEVAAKSLILLHFYHLAYLLWYKRKGIDMHKIAKRLANSCVEQEWISEHDRIWCVYAIEKKLLSCGFFSMLILVAICLRVLPQTLLFSVPFYILRRRFGGWHAPCVWLCQIISAILVALAVFIMGPYIIKQWTLQQIWCANMGVMVLAWNRTPVYPPQLHFDSGITIANNRKKNVIVLVATVVQVCFGCMYQSVLVYIFLAVLTGVISVYIEIFQQRINMKAGKL